ncbi:hypothetical protein Tco_0938149 [Tanacetum coccineum]|uniref:Uncharacterized protein n=1 Tax=Tanacetum coccineum TaxID=301880 RepID=A0ABQ5DGZ6_9ASTR
MMANTVFLYLAQPLKKVDVIKLVGNNKPSTMPSTSRDNEDGFVEVKIRKKKGKKDEGTRAFGGIRLSKPKSNVLWQQKKNKGSKSKSNVSSASVTTSGEKSTSPTLIAFDVLNLGGDVDQGL